MNYRHQEGFRINGREHLGLRSEGTGSCGRQAGRLRWHLGNKTFTLRTKQPWFAGGGAGQPRRSALSPLLCPISLLSQSSTFGFQGPCTTGWPPQLNSHLASAPLGLRTLSCLSLFPPPVPRPRPSWQGCSPPFWSARR